MNWYVIHALTGYESKVKDEIEHLATIQGWRRKLGRVIIPLEKVVSKRGAEDKAQQRSLMPGYVFIEIEAEEEFFNQILRLPGVTSFLGAGGKPEPLRSEEVTELLDLITPSRERPKKIIKFRKGEHVKVIDGPFANFVGVISEIDEEKARLRVLVTIFGRETPLELESSQVEAI